MVGADRQDRESKATDTLQGRPAEVTKGNALPREDFGLVMNDESRSGSVTCLQRLRGSQRKHQRLPDVRHGLVEGAALRGDCDFKAPRDKYLVALSDRDMNRFGSHSPRIVSLRGISP